MAKGYWERQLNRRHVLRGAATAGLGAAALAVLNCGGSSDGGEDQAPVSEGLIQQPKDTSSQAKRGVTYADYHVGDETTLDPMTTTRGAGTGGFEKPGYQKIIREKMVAGGSNKQTFEGDAAESFELTKDGLQLTIKLRPNNKLDPRPPTNGRVLNAQDIVYSWNTLVERSTYASIISYKASNAVPVESATAVDDRTVVYKMAFPWAALLPAFGEGGPHQIIPVEAEDKFDPKNTIRGSGPWMLEYEPSVAFRWQRNPGYFDSKVPYLDGYDQPILPEYASQLSQFRAKRIWDFRPTAADLGPTVQDLAPSGLQVYQAPLGISHTHMYFPGRPGGIFRDVRMRRAASMSIDRMLLADTLAEKEKLTALGLPPQIVINNNITAGYTDFWLDPFGKDMGDAAQWFKFNQAEAKKLISAAGYPDGLDVVAKVSSRSHGSGPHADIVHQMLREVGIRVKHETVDYNTIYLPNILRKRGDWDGDLTYSGGGTGFSPATGLQRVWHWDGGTTRVSCLSQPCDDDHRKIGEAIEKALREVDPEAYRSQIYELQRMMGRYQGAIVTDFQTAPLDLVWPWVQNWNVFRGVRETSGLQYVWVDESKMTR